ncbi:MAG: MMPL family transporter [Bacteroidales bacterium]|nr:MMPL family transporter [Bacteroidales bacterium]
MNLIIASILLIFLGLKAFSIKMGHNLANTLPETDTTMVVYRQFLEKYGQDGRSIFVGMCDDSLFTLKHFQDYYDLNEKIRELPGVTECLSVTRVFNIVKNDSIKKFELVQVVKNRPETQAEVDSIREVIESLAMYDGLLFNSETHSTMMLLNLDEEHANTTIRRPLIDALSVLLNEYGDAHGIEMHISGMPYIREITTQTMVKEIVGFTFLSIIVAGLILYLFFRSWRPLVSVITIVLLSVIYMFGIMAALGYEVTILTGVLPPLLIIIGVENSIFMLNKYHREFEVYHDKIQALRNTIMRIGPANLLTNTTTAVSFASFIITRNVLLVPFGILASICIMLTYVMTMVLLPTFFSYQKRPEGKLVNYMNSPRIAYIMAKISAFVLSKKRYIYAVLAVLLTLCVVSATQMTTSGRVVDDISEKSKMYKDIMFFEDNVGGVMPFEISIDTRKPRGVMNAVFVRKVQQLQDTLAMYPEFSEPLSIAEVVKFARQGFFNGKRDQYKIPNNNEFGFIMKYMPETKNGELPKIVTQYIDNEMQSTRISVQMANVTTPKIDSISRTLRPKIEQIFPSEKYDVVMTGSAMVTLQGTNYLIVNLSHSLLLAFIVIALLMVITFHKFKMVLISLIPNLIPLVFTAGVMGVCGIPLKMSTILVFSIALGISVDNTIHYLARYRLQMKNNKNDIKKSVMAAIMETGPSMIYSATILICGFLIFAFSSFGGTKIVGFLVPFTLLIALITNILVLPALVLTFNRKKI